MGHAAASLSICVLFLVAALPVRGQSPNVASSDNRRRNQVDIFTRGNYRYIKSNGIPDHQHGRFPNRNNPNAIRPQNYDFRVPLRPQPAARVTAVERQAFGVAINGILFDPGTAEYWQRDRSTGWRYEALSGKINLGLDSNNAHVQPTGAYHYHGLPTGLIRHLNIGRRMQLLGYAADGFPVYNQYGYADPHNAKSTLEKVRSSYQLKSGTRPGGPGGRYDGTFVQDYEYVKGSGDLDQCNGRFGVTSEYPSGTYHYYLTEIFPFVPRYYRGTPDKSFHRRGPPSGRQPYGDHSRPPRRP